MLKKSVDIQSGRVIVSLQGSLYMEEAARLREQLLALFDAGNKNFLIDLASLENMDTTGLGVFISLYKRAKTAGGNVVIRGIHGSVKELFALTGMDQVFTFEN